jgi:hypothetical protein
MVGMMRSYVEEDGGAIPTATGLAAVGLALLNWRECSVPSGRIVA